MRRPGYVETLEYAHVSLHKNVDLHALGRHVGGDHRGPFSPWALNNTFKSMISGSSGSATITDHVAFAEWLAAEVRSNRTLRRDRNRKQLRYAAKAWEVAALCSVVVDALAEGVRATAEDLVVVARDWLPTRTIEERAALLAVWRLGGVEALRELMGSRVQSLRQRAAARQDGRGPRRAGERNG